MLALALELGTQTNYAPGLRWCCRCLLTAHCCLHSDHHIPTLIPVCTVLRSTSKHLSRATSCSWRAPSPTLPAGPCDAAIFVASYDWAPARMSGCFVMQVHVIEDRGSSKVGAGVGYILLPGTVRRQHLDAPKLHLLTINNASSRSSALQCSRFDHIYSGRSRQQQRAVAVPGSSLSASKTTTTLNTHHSLTRRLHPARIATTPASEKS